MLVLLDQRVFIGVEKEGEFLNIEVGWSGRKGKERDEKEQREKPKKNGREG